MLKYKRPKVLPFFVGSQKFIFWNTIKVPLTGSYNSLISCKNFFLEDVFFFNPGNSQKSLGDKSGWYGACGMMAIAILAMNSQGASTLCRAAECNTLLLCGICREFDRVHIKKEYFAKVTKTVERDQRTPSDSFL